MHYHFRGGLGLDLPHCVSRSVTEFCSIEKSAIASCMGGVSRAGWRWGLPPGVYTNFSAHGEYRLREILLAANWGYETLSWIGWERLKLGSNSRQVVTLVSKNDLSNKVVEYQNIMLQLREDAWSEGR